MASIDQHRQTDRARPSVVDERVHRRPDGPTGEEHVVNEHQDSVIDREWDRRLAHHRRVAHPGQVVAIEGYVDRAEWDLDAFVGADRFAKASRKRVAARAYADDRETGKVAVALHDLVADPGKGAAHVVRAE